MAGLLPRVVRPSGDSSGRARRLVLAIENNEEPVYRNAPRILLRDAADDLLREMATPYDAPSGTVYRQGGEPVQSLGVFEHWDADESRRYSRNLDPENGKGIEFVYIPTGSAREA